MDLSKVEKIRKLKKITQKDLCEMSGVNKRTYEWWIRNNGTIQPSADKIKKIADALGVSVDTLTGDSGTPEAEEFFVKYGRHENLLEKISALHKGELGLLAEIIDVFYKFSKTTEIYKKENEAESHGDPAATF